MSKDGIACFLLECCSGDAGTGRAPPEPDEGPDGWAKYPTFPIYVAAVRLDAEKNPTAHESMLKVGCQLHPNERSRRNSGRRSTHACDPMRRTDVVPPCTRH
jgi:hypothetical protein